MTTSVERYRWLDILKFFGIFLVAFGHIYTNEEVLQWLYTFHVPLFFVAGGVVYRPREIWEDIRRRAFKILVPYFLFGLLILLYYYFIERQFRDVQVGFLQGLSGLFIGDMQHLEFHSHLWFLPCYFITSIVYNILYKLLKPIGCYIACGAATLAYALLPIPSLPWGIDRMCGFLGLFALGHIAAEKKLTEKAAALPVSAKLACAAVVIGISVALSIFGLTDGLLWIVCAIVGTVGFSLLSMAIDRANLIARIGGMNLLALCVHGPIYRVLLKIVSMLLDTTTDAIRADVLISLAVTAVTLAVCCAGHLLLEKIMPWSIGISPQKHRSIQEKKTSE